MKFLVDANLPPALAAWLRSAGAQAAHVDDLLPPSAPDKDVWELALREAAIIVSKDADFAYRADRDEGVQVVWIRCGNLKLSAFETWFMDRREAMLELLRLRERVVELR